MDSEGESGTEFIDFIEAPEDLEEDILKREEILQLRKAVSRLPFEEMELIIMVYYSGTSLKTFAEKKGLSYGQAVRMKNRTLKRLSDCLKR